MPCGSFSSVQFQEWMPAPRETLRTLGGGLILAKSGLDRSCPCGEAALDFFFRQAAAKPKALEVEGSRFEGSISYPGKGAEF